MPNPSRSQKLIIGLDEAGYGPNLGPFCVGMSVWIVPQKVHASELTSILHPLFQNRPLDKTQSWIPLGDSKLLYKSQGSAASLTFGLAVLESLAGLESSTSQTHFSARPNDGDHLTATSDCRRLFASFQNRLVPVPCGKVRSLSRGIASLDGTTNPPRQRTFGGP